MKNGVTMLGSNRCVFARQLRDRNPPDLEFLPQLGRECLDHCTKLTTVDEYRWNCFGIRAPALGCLTRRILSPPP